jgi:soluble lytic murein transglycosylase-like protein
MISVQKAIFPGIALGCVFIILITGMIASPVRSIAASAPSLPIQAPTSFQPAEQPLPEPTNAITAKVQEIFAQAPADPVPAEEIPAAVEEAPAEPEATVESIPEEEQAEACGLSSGYPDEVRQWCDLIQRYAEKYGVEPNLVAAVMMQESRGNKDAYSKSGAVGLMQVMPRDGLAAGFTCINGPCFASRPSMNELYDPEFNVDYGVRMLSGLINKHGDVREALKAYGPMNYGYRYADIILGIMANHQ